MAMLHPRPINYLRLGAFHAEFDSATLRVKSAMVLEHQCLNLCQGIATTRLTTYPE